MSILELSQLLGNFGEFFGSIAVFATLIYLSIQVKQSKRATEANTEIAQQNYSMALAQNQISRAELITQQVLGLAMSSELSEIFVKHENDGINSLSKVERLRFENFQLILYYILDSQHAQYTLGLLDEDSWQDAVRRIKEQAKIWSELDMDIVGRQAFAEEVARIQGAS